MRKRRDKVVLKIPGDMYAGAGQPGFDDGLLRHVVSEIAHCYRMCPLQQMAIVVGGSIHGKHLSEDLISVVEADELGMVSTIINAKLLSGALSRCQKINARVVSALPIAYAEMYVRTKVARKLPDERLVIIAGGLGRPGFTTDLAAVTFGIELGVQVVLRATGLGATERPMDPFAQRQASASNLEVIEFDLSLEGSLYKMLTSG
ncbi:MAG: hypothetical protein AAB367_03265 [Patescibacteria group bacterium]